MQKNLKNNSGIAKLAVFLAAIFAAAVFAGFISRNENFSNRDQATRKDLMLEMARIITTLNPLLEIDAFSESQKISHREIPVELEIIAGLGIIKSYPDGTWKLSQKITRGESIFYFDQFFNILCQNLRIKSRIVETSIPFPDINQDHWLRGPLNRLGGTGALMFSDPARFQANQIISEEEIRFIGSAIIEYLANNLLLVFFDGKSIKISGKGASHEVTLKDWSYSFDSIKWHDLSESGEINATFDNKKVCRIFFRNPAYINSGPIRLYDLTPSVASIKLQKNLSSSVRSAIAEKQPQAGAEGERERLRKRLEELRNAKLLTGNTEKEVNASETIEIKKIEPEPCPIIEKAEPVQKCQEQVEAKLEKLPVLQSEKKPVEEFILPEGTSRYEARIFDSLSGKRLQNAMLITGSTQITADSDGNIFFHGEPDSIIEITAFCEGYEPLQMKHRIGYRPGPLILSLKPVLTSFSGRIICEETGAPVARALIKLGDRATRSDENGNFSIKTLPGGYHQLSCFADRYMEAHEIVYVEKNSGSPFQLVLKPILASNSAPAN